MIAFPRFNSAYTGLFVTLVVSTPLMAHHGSGISYDLANSWTTKATVTEFQYKNPHPWLEFDRVNDEGETEHWTAELLTNPTFLLRAGWTKARSLEVLRPGTVVELTLSTARAGGFNAIVRSIRDENGNAILTGDPADPSITRGSTDAPSEPSPPRPQ